MWGPDPLHQLCDQNKIKIIIDPFFFAYILTSLLPSEDFQLRYLTPLHTWSYEVGRVSTVFFYILKSVLIPTGRGYPLVSPPRSGTWKMVSVDLKRINPPSPVFVDTTIVRPVTFRRRFNSVFNSVRTRAHRRGGHVVIIFIFPLDGMGVKERVVAKRSCPSCIALPSAGGLCAYTYPAQTVCGSADIRRRGTFIYICIRFYPAKTNRHRASLVTYILRI